MRTSLQHTQGQNEMDPQSILTGQNSSGQKERTATLLLVSYYVDLCDTKRYELCAAPLHMVRFHLAA